LANVDNNPNLESNHTILPVDSFPGGKGPYGGVNFCGNVWEWVDATAPPPNGEYLKMMQRDSTLVPPPTLNDLYYQIRGGYYGMPLTAEMISDSAPFPVRLSSRVIGFRCAKNADR
jgi:hypothetical protein